LPEFRQSRAARNHGAACGSHRRHAEACRFFETPITGGNVSLYNETLGEGIWPTPVLGIVGLMKTAAPVTRRSRTAGRVMLLGGIGDATNALRRHAIRQEFCRSCGDCRRRSTWITRSGCNAMREIVAAGLAESAHDLSDGGLAVALAECCFGGESGAAIEFRFRPAPEYAVVPRRAPRAF
jgi:phosphoribosylformylglycinamidine synthase subunit PurL